MAAPLRVKALYEYSSLHDEDLNFPAGQIITVTDQEDADWYEGEYHDDDGAKKQGIFPRNFVEKYEPTAPPRPARTRAKKEADGATRPPAEQAPLPPTTAAPAVPRTDPSEAEVDEVDAPMPRSQPVEHPSAPIPVPAPSKPAESTASPTSPRAGNMMGSLSPPAAAPGSVSSAKKQPSGGPPPVSEKPSGNSFKDRIAAFNKPAAPPIAPFKPGGLAAGSGSSASFIKKPFVPPPPSRNAYVPPPREAPTTSSYKRDEDPEIKEREAANLEQAERAGLAPSVQQSAEGDEDQPKPTSLKERIALLQKQQMEQAQRHADAAARKEKPKKPTKAATEAHTDAETAIESTEPTTEAAVEGEAASSRTVTEHPTTTRGGPSARRRTSSSKGPAPELVHDSNDADMSGGGDTSEGHDDTTEREDSDEKTRRTGLAASVSMALPQAAPARVADEAVAQEQEEEEEEEDHVDPEVRRKEELRARMAKMSGGMGFHGMFGAPVPPSAVGSAKKKTAKAEAQEPAEETTSPISRAAPPVPTPMALPGMGGPRMSDEKKRATRDEASAAPSRAAPPPLPTRPADDDGNRQLEDEEEEDEVTTPAPHMKARGQHHDVSGGPPRTPSRRPPPPPPVPADSRPPPPPPADLKTATDGSESDDELSARERSVPNVGAMARSPPMPPHPVQAPELPARSPPQSPRHGGSSPPLPPLSTAGRRNSRPPPPIPGAAPVPVPMHSRPPPPPPPPAPARASTMDGPTLPAVPTTAVPTRPPQAGEDEAEENTEYEGDYDTDIASSVHHKNALKAHARDSSLEDNGPQSPVADAPTTPAPPVPSMPAAAPPRSVPPPIPVQPPPADTSGSSRRSMDTARSVPRVPPPAKEAHPQRADEHEAHHPSASVMSGAISSGRPMRTPPRASTDIGRTSMSGRRSLDVVRPSMESGFIASDVDLAVQSGWWKQAKQVPPALQGRQDIYFETEESTTTNQGSQTIVTREVFVLYQDYSQTVLTARYDPYRPSEVELEQRHEGPPRALRQDQMEEFHEQYGRRIAEAAAAKKDTVVGDGTAQGLVAEVLRPLTGALRPVGTRAYGALVYANMANASTQQHDVIRPGDIMSVRKARFQGKHGPMHAKYSAEVGKPDHAAVVAEWDGTKKKVRAWEQGRESRKVKLESFKLDDLRSGEVKIWRVVPRSWVGWGEV